MGSTVTDVFQVVQCWDLTRVYKAHLAKEQLNHRVRQSVKLQQCGSQLHVLIPEKT